MRPIRMHNYGKMLRILSRLSFFEKFSQIEQLELVKAKNMFVVADPDEQIVQRGVRGNSFYVVVSGRAGVFPPHGGDPVAVLEAGEVFGEVAFLSGAERTADVRAIDQAILFWMDRKSMVKLQVPLREKIKDKLIDRLVVRIQYLNDQLYGGDGAAEEAPAPAAGPAPDAAAGAGAEAAPQPPADGGDDEEPLDEPIDEPRV